MYSLKLNSKAIEIYRQKSTHVGEFVCVWVSERETYSLHFSVSRSSDSCLRAFSVSPTTASTPFSCVCVCVCVCVHAHACVCMCMRVYVWEERGLSDIKPKVKWEGNMILMYSPHSPQGRWNCACSELTCRRGDYGDVARERNTYIQLKTQQYFKLLLKS